MSTKLYNGIKFKSNDIVEVLHQLQDLKDSFSKLCVEEFYKDSNICRLWFRLCEDKFDFEQEHVTYELERKVKRYLREETKQVLDPDFGFSVIVIPHTDGHIYGYYFNHSDSKECEVLLFEKLADPYGYWNNTDQPEGLSDEEWEQREAVWDEICDDAVMLVDMGFEFELASSTDWWRCRLDGEEILERINEYKEGIKNGADS